MRHLLFSIPVFLVTAFFSSKVLACGCFAPPSPAEPVVQAGEQIVFAHRDGRVEAHIRIQYEGDASEFAWLVPVPSRPEFKLSNEALFTELDRDTRPQFLLNSAFCAGLGGGGGGGFGCAGDDDSAEGAGGNGFPQDRGAVDVELGSAGPFDYAIVQADSKQPLIDWLNENRFFVPTEVEGVLDPYVRSGSHFLAVKLRAGETVGSIQPVMITYEADVPMIPIILTSASAIQDMGVLVWVLGDDRAVPTNYYTVEINQEYLDWIDGASNYAQVAARAVDEAEEGQAFLTEYAGPTAGLRSRWLPADSLPNREDVERAETLEEIAPYLRLPIWPTDQLLSILERYYPYPRAAEAAGVPRWLYYTNLDDNVPLYDPERVLDAEAIAQDLWERIVEPLQAAEQLVAENDTVTRFFTALDPDEMTRDPVFDFNPDLSPVDRLHVASLDSACDGSGGFEMVLEDGRAFPLDNIGQWMERNRRRIPRATTVSVLRLEGPGEVVIDNSAFVSPGVEPGSTISRDSGTEEGGGCRAYGRRYGAGIEMLLIILSVAMATRVRRPENRRWRRSPGGE